MTEKSDWSNEYTQKVIAEIVKRRKAEGITVAQLAERTKLAGFPISASVLTNMETGRRKDRLTVAELIVIAHVLGTNPALLLSPGYPDGELEGLPNRTVSAKEFFDWIVGTVSGWPIRVKRDGGRTGVQASSGMGAQLVRFVEERSRVAHEAVSESRRLAIARDPDAEAPLRSIQARIGRLNQHIKESGGVVVEKSALTDEQREALLDFLNKWPWKSPEGE
ncbi:hypothetical protein HMPREF2878_08880 [Corynebacterium sp. HMSC065H09]|uniref:helix-turn-helix domain-containing protein n=1 Tax=Corynebacterium sp. HMSC065H09 TaxID=1739382 RepID=UPI0008A55EE2|nr:helix-turn-helix transcriptional regulator [Corynebacterium sp. HMSC065H09]OFR59511.1 hypothetical protein HMPREF2878_08880 [Corynebacterium sp. HMSC065H09]